MSDKTRSGSSSRRAAGSSGTLNRSGTPTPGASDPTEESTILAVVPESTTAIRIVSGVAAWLQAETITVVVAEAPNNL